MNQFAEIRRHYTKELPQMMAEYERTGNMHFDPYQLDFTSTLTPIEQQTWIAIRSYGVPMYPQIPALNYFFDFANPFIKVAIECDGKQYHDVEKDAKRDARLQAVGWTIYRIPGWQCNKYMREPWEKFRESREDGQEIELHDRREYCREWFCNTCDGVVMAINMHYFGKQFDDEAYSDGAGETLNKHCSTGDER
jgi:very-short-patch-repair endonuclease